MTDLFAYSHELLEGKQRIMNNRTNHTDRAAYRHDGVPGAAGVIAHQVVASLIPSYGGRVPVKVISTLIADECSAVGSGLNGRRVYALAVSATAKYLNFLRPTDCVFVASELVLPGSRPDLVYRSDRGVFFDELKTGKYVNRFDIAEQVAAQLTAGKAEFGSEFLGVRIVATSSPRSSYLARPSGTTIALNDSDFGFGSLRSAHLVGGAA